MYINLILYSGNRRRSAPFLLYVEERDVVSLLDEQDARARIEDLLAVRHLHLLRHFVLEVLDQNLQVREHSLYITYKNILIA